MKKALPALLAAVSLCLLALCCFPSVDAKWYTIGWDRACAGPIYEGILPSFTVFPNTTIFDPILNCPVVVMPECYDADNISLVGATTCDGVTWNASYSNVEPQSTCQIFSGAVPPYSFEMLVSYRGRNEQQITNGSFIRIGVWNATSDFSGNTVLFYEAPSSASLPGVVLTNFSLPLYHRYFTPVRTITLAVCANNVATPGANVSNILMTDSIRVQVWTLNQTDLDECWEEKGQEDARRAGILNDIKDCLDSSGYSYARLLSKSWRKNLKLARMQLDKCHEKLDICNSIIALGLIVPLPTSSILKRGTTEADTGIEYPPLHAPLYDSDILCAWDDCQKKLERIRADIDDLLALNATCGAGGFASALAATEAANRIAENEYNVLTSALAACEAEFAAKNCSRLIDDLKAAQAGATVAPGHSFAPYKRDEKAAVEQLLEKVAEWSPAVYEVEDSE